MELYFKGNILGSVIQVDLDFPWVIGNFTPNESEKEMRKVFDLMIDEDLDVSDFPFLEEFLDDENWWMADDGGNKKKISVPAVHKDNLIWWRWRE